MTNVGVHPWWSPTTVTKLVAEFLYHWVREGAAIYFAGEQTIPGESRQRPAVKPEPRASCPEDNELLRPSRSAR